MYNKTLAIGAGVAAALLVGVFATTPLVYAQTLSELALIAFLEAQGLSDLDSQGQCKKVIRENLPEILSIEDLDVKDKQVKQFIKAFCSEFSK
jgi:hypothetical protein